MLVVAGLCAADLIYGMGTLLLNAYRVAIIILGLHTYPATAWKCVTMPHIFMAKIGGQLTAMMNLAVSVDRYFAVAYPVKYLKLSINYAKISLGVIFVYFLGSSTIMIGATYFDEPIFAAYTWLCVNAVFPR
uniref:G-protein coupled receptors family 1 profile domain-containing protein n=1 Tax=Plectus sambesii TaxID=2011161 RepID=A0A914UKT7_9BILA